MRNWPVAGFGTAAVLFVLDQLAKLGVTQTLGLNDMSDAVYVAPIFNLRFVANHGVSLGLLHADNATSRWALVAMTAVIAAGVAVWMVRERMRAERIALGLILGGALGNIVDRVRLGYVVDYADLHIGEYRPFLVFNLADAAITIGVLVVLVRALLMRDKREPAPKPSPVETPHA